MLGFEHPAFRLRGKRSNPLRHRRGNTRSHRKFIKGPKKSFVYLGVRLIIKERNKRTVSSFNVHMNVKQ